MDRVGLRGRRKRVRAQIYGQRSTMAQRMWRMKTRTEKVEMSVMVKTPMTKMVEFGILMRRMTCRIERAKPLGVSQRECKGRNP